MPEWGSTLLGVAVGAALAYVAAARIERARRHTDARDERRRALAMYLGRLYIVVGFMHQWPEELPPSLLVRLRRATLERSRSVRARDWIRTQKELRAILGDSPFESLHRLTEAYAALQLAGLSGPVLREVETTRNYVERLAHDRSPATRTEWPALQERLLQAIAQSGDASVVEIVEQVSLSQPAPG